MSDQDKRMHQEWVKQGLLEPCDGKMIDYTLVESRIREDREKYDLREIAFDPHNASEIATRLDQSVVPMVMFVQSFNNWNEPYRKFLMLAESHELAHGGHGILKWNAKNLETAVNRNDYWAPLKPQTKKSVQIRRRIDGVVAAIMGLDRCMANPLGSVYDSEGMKTL